MPSKPNSTQILPILVGYYSALNAEAVKQILPILVGYYSALNAEAVKGEIFKHYFGLHFEYSPCKWGVPLLESVGRRRHAN